MSAKLKKIIISIVIIVVCAAVVTTVLVLPLTGKKDDGHIVIDDGTHTVSGELDISLMRERLETLTYNEDGLPVRNANENLTDFSKSNDNVFGFDENTIIAPECYFKADMVITNKKPYAFEYWLEIIPENGENLLVDQLELTVEAEGVYIKRTLQSGLETQIFPKVNSEKSGKFSVQLKYISLEDNDKTKNTTLAFDMIVHARLTES